ncbi:MAG: nuclear transport factor 2 family protein, partial [Proteobacteria bacterium]|nr:nuclear transport factor 2 family protein [Pseudomonadota bacterium]
MRPTAFPTPQDAENAFYDALERADLEAMMAVWAEDEEIVCVHPTGPRLAGHEQVRESWRQIFSGAGGVRIHVTQLVATQAMMVAIHSVQENAPSPGGKGPAAAVVATNVYLRTAAGWRMILHHASHAPGQPQG